MKVLALADHAEPKLWERLDRRILEGVELVLSCGDLPASYLSFLTCFTSAPVLYVHGNHDTTYEKTPPEGCVCVDDKVYNHGGVRVMGLGGCMCYRPGAPHQYSEREMAARLRRLRLSAWRQGGIDILLSHAPALGLGDEPGLAHRGFQTFLRAMDRYHPQYMIHGHVHVEYTHAFQRERQYGQTRVINACGYCLLEVGRGHSVKNE